MNRRSILALFGGAAAIPSMGVKAAAQALGLETALVANTAMPVASVGHPGSGDWWRSPINIAMEAQRDVQYQMNNGRAYPHMKSWGHGFRQIMAERDAIVMAVYRHKLQDDEVFRNKALAALGVVL